VGGLLAENEYRVLQRQVAALRVAVAISAILWLGTTTWLVIRSPSIPPVLAVERLEIVEPDGTPAVVIANSQRPIAATIGGQVIMRDQEEERRGVPSMIFFDGKGDEVGGLLFGVRTSAGGFSAVRQLSLDAYGQDQTVVLRHIQDPRGSTSGLVISQRPNHSILDALKELGLAPGAPRAAMDAAIEAVPEAGRAERLRGLFGTERAFLGAVPSGEATLTLRDGQGRRRIVIEAPDGRDPSIRILDAQGNTVLRLPESEP
jgi:hypothetical protein